MAQLLGFGHSKAGMRFAYALTNPVLAGLPIPAKRYAQSALGLIKERHLDGRIILKGSEDKMENKERQDMNRLAFVMSNILTFLGIVLLSIALMIRAILTGGPSHFLFKAFIRTGSWKPEAYAPNLSGVYVISAICIVVGLVLSVVFYKNGSK